MSFRFMSRGNRAQSADRVLQAVQAAVEPLEQRQFLTASPYILPVDPAVTTQSLLTVGDTVPLTGSNVGQQYRMVGIPDGLGAFDNGDGTFTVLMNQELGFDKGVPRDHGAAGAFVSKYIIRKSDLAVLSGSDLIKAVYDWNVNTQSSNTTSSPIAFNRFCSADLAGPNAFYNPANGKGTTNRIYMNGEESDGFGKPLANIVTGPDAGKSYVLGKFNLGTNGSGTTFTANASVTSASTLSNVVTLSSVPFSINIGQTFLGRTITAVSNAAKQITLDGNANEDITSASGLSRPYTGPVTAAWENLLANPNLNNLLGDTTVVIGNGDGGTGIMNNSVAVYVGTKQGTGTVADKAGLTNGVVKFVNITGNTAELANTTTRATNITSGTRFTLSASSSTTFSRPEDGAWDPKNPNVYYFVTTDQLDRTSDSLTPAQTGQTRLWRLTFDDVRTPDAGGKIDLLIDGRVVNGQKVNMFDNITVNAQTGHIVMLEDVGNAPHNGKVWDYDPASDTLVQLAKHDPARFGDVGLAATAPFTVDEETSGVIDVSAILNKPNSYLLVDQAHYPINSANPNGFTNPDELVEGGQLMLLTETPKVSFLAVGAGDANSTSAVLWTRAQDVTRGATGVGLIAQVSTDPTFATGLATFAGTTDPAHDFTIHVNATGLQPGTRYFYRFVADDGTISSTGTLVTAPSTTANVPVSLGFTGDADGLMRPYGATNSPNFAGPTTTGVGSQAFDYFVWLGDTIYESKSGDGTPNFSPVVNANPVVSEYWTKYKQQFLPVSTGSYPGLSSFFSSNGHYTLLDNHELGNQQYINGGAPASAPTNTTDTSFDVNTTGTYKHDTTAFKTLQQAYNDYQPVRVDTVVAPNDPRSNGTQKLYFAQQWGANNVFINVDDRTNRDIRLRKASGGSTADDTGDRADNAGRTMLGATELQWLKDTLVSAQQNGVTWKVVATSSPIDQIGAIGSGVDGGKSWIGGYRAERNALLKFIADNHIDHVVFLSTDDHLLRVNEVGYFTQFTTNSLGYQAPVQSSYVRIPGAISVIAGPIGATGPDTVTDHSFTNIKGLADALVTTETTAGVDPIGLDAAFPGLKNVFREGDASADTSRQAVDFYSPDTFNYATMNVSADGSTFSVGIKGINSYAVNTFPQPGTAGPVRDILSFQIGLKTTGLAISQTAATYGGKTTISARLTDSNGSPLSGKTVAFKLSGNSLGTATTGVDGVAQIPDIDISSYNAGTYTGAIQAFYDGDVSTLKSTSTADLTIGQASITVPPAVLSVTGGSFVCDLQPHAATATAAGIESPTPANLTPLLSLAYKNLATNVVSSSAPVQPGNYEVLVNFAGNTNYAPLVQFDSSQTVTISKAAATFGSLLNPTITVGTASTVLSGKITLTIGTPTGSVSISINGVSVPATIKSSGFFSASFPTSKLGVGTYTVQYGYAGSPTLNPAAATSKLMVTLKIAVLFNNTKAYKIGTTIPVKIEVEDVNGKDVTSSIRTAKATGIASVGTPKLIKPLPPGTANGGNFTANSDHSQFSLTLGTNGLSAGQYLLYFTLSGDPVLHALTIIVGK